MRAVLYLALAVFSTSATRAAGFPEPAVPLTSQDETTTTPALVGVSERTPPGMGHPRERLPLLGPPPTMPGGATSGFSIGPIRADSITRFSHTGKARLSPHYRLDGVSVFGGTIGGSVDGRGGMLTLNWHTAP